MGKARLIVKTYVSNAKIPLDDVFVYVEDSSGKSMGFDATNKEGQTKALEMEAPDKSLSLSPDSTTQPYAVCNVYVYKPKYFIFKIEGVQLFDTVTSVECVQMQPLAQNPSVSKLKIFKITPQQLGSSLGG